LAGTALAVAVPYMLIIGSVTNKTSGRDLLHGHRAGDVSQRTSPGAASALPVATTPRVRFCRTPLAMTLAVFHEGWREDFHPGGLGWGLAALAKETGKSFHYGLWVPTLLGLWCFRRRLRGEPGAWVPLVMCGCHAVLLTLLSVIAGYVSERHTLLFVMCGLSWAVAELLALPEQLGAIGRVLAGGRYRRAVEVVVLAALAASALPEALKPMHAGRVGHRKAGLWIAAHAELSDAVMDPFCWAHFYAGRVFEEGVPQPVPPAHTPKTFVVLDHSNHHSRIPQLPEARRLAEGHEPAYQWPSGQNALVEVYVVGE